MTTPDGTEGPEVDIFTFASYTWNVTAALALAADLPERSFRVESALQLLPFIRVDREWAGEVDLTVPVLVVPFAPVGSPLPIDGWHRLWRAHQKGAAEVPCKLLTDAQEARVRLAGGPKGQPDRRARRARALEERYGH